MGVQMDFAIPLVAGAGIRGHIKREVMAWCAVNGLALLVEEDKGLIQSLYIFRVSGDSDTIRELIDGLESMVAAIEESKEEQRARNATKERQEDRGFFARLFGRNTKS